MTQEREEEREREEMEMERWRVEESGERDAAGGGQGRQGGRRAVIGQCRAAAFDGAENTVLINHADLGFCGFPCA